MNSDTKFSDNFWDDKLTGYLVLLQNVRNSQQSVKEFENYLRECASSEDQYYKQVNKTSHLVQKFNQDSTIYPLWTSVLKEITEQNSWSHLKFMTKIYELIKKVQIYSDELRKRKHKLKENDTKTIIVIEQFRHAKVHLQRSKDQYVQIASELEKQKKIIEHTQLTNTASIQVLIQKLEKKLTVCVDEYQQAIERYNTIRLDYETRFAESCEQFQELEKWHLIAMKDFLREYLALISGLNASRAKNLLESENRLGSYTIEQLMDQFLLNKSTGQYRPIPAEFLKITDVEIKENMEKNETKILNFLSMDLLSKIKKRTGTRKNRPLSEHVIDLTNSGLFDAAPEPETRSLDSLEFNYVNSTNKDQTDMINLYELSNDENAKQWSKQSNSGSSSDDESDDSDLPKRIVLKIKPLDEKKVTSDAQLSQISKKLQLKSSASTAKRKVYTKSYKLEVDENNNNVEDMKSDGPPPLPPLPISLKEIMNQRVTELNRNLERSLNQSPLSKSCEDEEETIQF